MRDCAHTLFLIEEMLNLDTQTSASNLLKITKY